LYEVSAPGSAMLMGEHAVLHGYPAIVCALNSRLHAKLIPRTDNKICIHSDRFGKYIYHNLATDHYDNKQDLYSAKFQFIISAINYALQNYQNNNHKTKGFDLHISSQFSATIGFGSSAAVTVATLGVIQLWLQKKLDRTQIMQDGVNIIRKVQGRGSGADVAASTHGGILQYNAQTISAQKLANIPTIDLIYTGYKTPTVDVIEIVNKNFAHNKTTLKTIFNTIGSLTLKAITCIETENWIELGKLFDQHYQEQVKLGVSDTTIAKLILQTHQIKSVLGAKISGSGLGDCIVVLGDVANHIDSLQVSIDKNGLIIHEQK
jgi:mevalonate kinase